MILDLNASAGQSGKESTQVRADSEADGDFTPTWGKKWLFKIKPQQITLKAVGPIQKGIVTLWKQAQ